MLFKRAALCGDIHWGLRNDSEVHNQDCIEFIEWFCDQTIKNKCDVVIFMGDWHHNRIRTESRTGYYSRLGIERLDALGIPIYWILGNHELYLRNSRDIHSLHHLGKYKNINLIDAPIKIQNVQFSPWLVGDELENLKTDSAKYLFGHFELPFFLMNQVIEKVFDGNGPHVDDFVNYEAVYSGHFHKRQLRLNKFNVPIYFIGNCFGHDMNDVNDPERGMGILTWGETLPEYIAWPDAPTYHRYNISEFAEMLENGRKWHERSTIELIDDVNVQDDTVNDLKTFIQCRQIRIRKSKMTTPEETGTNVLKFNSFDEMVEHKLQTMIYDGKYDASLLLEIYRSV